MAAASSKSTSLWQILKTTLTQWLSDRGSRLAAAFSYYAIFSIGPLLIIALTMVGFFFGGRAASDQLRPQISQFIGEKAAGFVQHIVTNLASTARLSTTGIISILLIVYAATNLFISLQDALNTLFGVEPKPNRGILGILRDRLLSFLMVLCLGAIILVSIALTALLASLTKSLPTSNPALTALLLHTANFALSAVIFTGLFALMFKYLPDIRIRWRDTLIGGAVTSILFTLARVALGFYLGRSSITGPYGAAGSLVVIMLFIYYASQIFFLGAKFTCVFACRFGDPIRPSANAVAIKPAKPGEPHSLCDSPKQSASSAIATDAETYPASRYHPPMRLANHHSKWSAAVPLIALALVPLGLRFLRRR